MIIILYDISVRLAQQGMTGESDIEALSNRDSPAGLSITRVAIPHH